MPKEVELKKRPKCTIAYIEHVGAYGSVPYEKYFGQLYGWVKENKVRPGFMPLGIFYDCPETTPPEKCRSEIAVPITGAARPGKGVKIKELPAMTVAVIKHKAPASEYQNSYRKLYEWIAANGYECSGPPMELYTKKPQVVGGETILYAHIMTPVKKKK